MSPLQPSLRDGPIVFAVQLPSDESLGYYRTSLRDLPGNLVIKRDRILESEPDMETPLIKPRRPWLAGILSLLGGPVGQTLRWPAATEPLPLAFRRLPAS